MKVRLSNWVCPCVYPCILYSFFPPNKYFVTLLSIIVRILFLQSSRARTLSLTISLVAGIQCSHLLDWTLLSGQEPKPCFKPVQDEALQINGCVNTFQFFWASDCRNQLQNTACHSKPESNTHTPVGTPGACTPEGTFSLHWAFRSAKVHRHSYRPEPAGFGTLILGTQDQGWPDPAPAHYEPRLQLPENSAARMPQGP